jgi:hypothetical protein
LRGGFAQSCHDGRAAGGRNVGFGHRLSFVTTCLRWSSTPPAR